MAIQDPFGVLHTLRAPGGDVRIARLNVLPKAAVGSVERLPFSLKILLESLLRNCDGSLVTEPGCVRRILTPLARRGHDARAGPWAGAGAVPG